MQKVQSIFKILQDPNYTNPDLTQMAHLNDQAKLEIKRLFESFATDLWKDFDESIWNFVASQPDIFQFYTKSLSQDAIDTIARKYLGKTPGADIDTIKTQIASGDIETMRQCINLQLISFSEILKPYVNQNSEGFNPYQFTLQLRKSMIEAVFGNGKTEEQLTFSEKLALDLKISEMGYDIPRSDYSNIRQAYEGDNVTKFGVGILSANEDRNRSTARQVLMLFEDLLGRVSALSAGGGKSFVYIWTYSQCFHNGNSIGEFLGAQTTDAAQMIGSEQNVFMWRMLGIQTVNGDEKYKQNAFDELADAYDKTTVSGIEGLKGRVIAYSIGQRGFVELQARVGANGAKLNNALSNTDVRVADEADVAALSRVSYIMGTGDAVVPQYQADDIVGKLKTLQSVTFQAEDKEYKIQPNPTAKTQGDLAINEFAIIDGKIVCGSSELETAILEKFKSWTLLDYMQNTNVTKLSDIKGNTASNLSNIMRAWNVFAVRLRGGESVSFVDGQPASVEAGRRQSNTTDQSSSYNVALVALEIERLKGLNQSTKGFDIHNVKMSVSSGESTISQIFSREQGTTLNCGGSATLDVAREVAHAIFGGEAVDIEASSMKMVGGQLGNRFKVESCSKTQEIINYGVTQAQEFLKAAVDGTLKKDSVGADIGLLFGAMDMDYNIQIMINALAQIYAENFNADERAKIVESFTSNIELHTKGYSISEIKDWIANNSEYGVRLKPYLNKIQTIDAVIAENSPEAVSKMAGNRGMLTFSNQSGLRGIDFKSINMIVVDGHNFPSSELLQAIGRAGRNEEWGKDKTSVTVLMDLPAITKTLVRMKEDDSYFRERQSGLFDRVNRDLNENLRKVNEEGTNIESKDLLELVSVYKSMQLKSESILFKARQEAMYILVKEPLAEMAAIARRNSNVRDAEYLEDLYKKSIYNDESSLFQDSSKDGNVVADPMITMMQIYHQVLITAQAYLTTAMENTSDSLIKLEFVNRLQDIKLMLEEDAFSKLVKEASTNDNYSDSTFAQSSRRVNAKLGFSPAQDIAKTLISLSSNLLPTRSNDGVGIGQTPQSILIVTDNMTDAQKARSQTFIDAFNADAENPNGQTLAYKNSSGRVCLTDKGKVIAAFAQKTIMSGNSEAWAAFLKWLFNLMGLNLDTAKLSEDQYVISVLKDLTNTLSDKGIKNPRAIRNFVNMLPDVNYNEITSIEQLQRITEFEYSKDFQETIIKMKFTDKGCRFPSAQAMALAREGLLKNDKAVSDHWWSMRVKGEDLNKVLVSAYDEFKQRSNEVQVQAVIMQSKITGEGWGPNNMKLTAMFKAAWLNRSLFRGWRLRFWRDPSVDRVNNITKPGSKQFLSESSVVDDSTYSDFSNPFEDTVSTGGKVTEQSNDSVSEHQDSVFVDYFANPFENEATEQSNDSDDGNISLEEPTAATRQESYTVNREALIASMAFAGIEINADTEKGIDALQAQIQNMSKADTEKVFGTNIISVNQSGISFGDAIKDAPSKKSVFLGVGLGATVGTIIGGVLGLGAGALVGAMIGAAIGGLLLALGGKTLHSYLNVDFLSEFTVMDVNKFAKIPLFTKLVKNGTLDFSDDETHKHFSASRLRDAINMKKDAEKILIIGKKNWETIIEFKEEIIEKEIESPEFLREHKRKDGEDDKQWEERRLQEARREFSWTLAKVGGLIERLKFGGNENQKQKLFAVLFGSFRIDYKTILTRFNNVRQSANVIYDDIPLFALNDQDGDLFDKDNKPTQKFWDKYSTIASIEQKIDDEVGVENAGRELLGKMAEGFTKPQDLNSAVVKALLLFEDRAAMEKKYLGLDPGANYTRQDIAKAAYKLYSQALGLYAGTDPIDKRISLDQLHQESEIIRVVADMLMAMKLSRDGELVSLINKKQLDIKDVSRIQELLELNTKPNRNVFLDVLSTGVTTSKEGNPQLFEIDMSKLKTALETEHASERELLAANSNDLLPLLNEGKRGEKERKTLLMEIRDVRAVAKAA